jgi:hypothetical protein
MRRETLLRSLSSGMHAAAQYPFALVAHLALPYQHLTAIAATSQIPTQLRFTNR